MIEIPKCYERGCKYYTGIKKSGKATFNCCKAYPDGIPDEISYGENTHAEVQKDQAGDFVFVKEEEEKELDEDEIFSKGGHGSGILGHRTIRDAVSGMSPKQRASALAKLKEEQARRSGGRALKAGESEQTFLVAWEIKVPTAVTKASITKIKKNGVNRVVLEDGANGSYVDTANKVLTGLQTDYPYIKEKMAKNKIDLILTGKKTLEATSDTGKKFAFVGYYEADELTMTKKGLDNAFKSIKGSPVVAGDKGKSPFSSSNGIAHEIGHHLMDNDSGRINEFEWYDLWNGEKKKNKNFTMYGKTDESEGFAESFALYTHPKGKSNLLPDTVKFFDRYLKVGKKKDMIGLDILFKIGTARSGNRGHAGIPGHVGGSKPGKVGSNVTGKLKTLRVVAPGDLGEKENEMYKKQIEKEWEKGPRRDMASYALESIADKAYGERGILLFDDNKRLKGVLSFTKGSFRKDGSVDFYSDKGKKSLCVTNFATREYGSGKIIMKALAKEAVKYKSGINAESIEGSFGFYTHIGMKNTRGMEFVFTYSQAKRFAMIKEKEITYEPINGVFVVNNLRHRNFKKKSIIGLGIFFKGGHGSGNYDAPGKPRFARQPSQARIGLANRVGFSYSDKLDETEYAKLSATAKVTMLKDKIKGYKEQYVPKFKQRRILSKLSTKGKTTWLEFNKSVGAMEGVRRAMVARGNNSIRVEQRKHYHFSIKLQETISLIRKDMKRLK